MHIAQVISYLKTMNLFLGLLLNFKVPLLKQGIRRVPLSSPLALLATWRFNPGQPV
jgi:hypothetical protein